MIKSYKIKICIVTLIFGNCYLIQSQSLSEKVRLLDLTGKVYPIDTSAYLSNWEKGEREFAVGFYFYWHNIWDKAYFWLCKAEKDGGYESDNDYILNQKKETALLYYLKGQCEADIKKYQDAIISYSKCIDVSMKTLKYVDYFRETSYYIQEPKNYSLEYSITDNQFIEDSIIKKGKYLIKTDWSINTIPFKAYYQRATCKTQLEDFYGTIADIQRFHSVVKDSTAHSCYVYAYAALKLNRNKTAIKYYSTAIKKKEDSSMSEEGLMVSYINRGGAYYAEGLKEKACLDWSEAVNLGSKEAINDIKDFCNK